ncbi:MAG: hypothetical protein RLZZ611_415 [Cyanobacteriota bacterium]|jgi:hypothetical protein
MNDHQLGTRLRQQILSDLERGLGSDGRRLQALMGDFCGDEQLPLLPALRYLVLSPGFNNALAQQPPLAADGRLQLRLQQELEQVFTQAICKRMGAVLSGLLGLPEPAMLTNKHQAAQPVLVAPVTAATQPAAAFSSTPSASTSAAEPLEQPPSAGHQRSGGNNGSGLAALLGAMIGMLMAAVVGGVTWLVLLNREPQPISNSPTSPTVESPAAETTIPVKEPAPSQPPPAPDLSQQVSADQAIASVQQLYANLSSGNIDAARQLFSPAAADQFDPGFFSQFREVRVSDLRETGRSGSSVSLEGVVTFVYPDGSSQVESRTFTVENTGQTPLITGSSFGAVIKARG